GNKWTITSGGQVAVNGVVDATTARVTVLAYEKGLVWQENADKLWWSKSKPTDAWGPAAGTTTSPIPPTVTPVPTPAPTPVPSGAIVVGSGSDSIVLMMSEDADGPIGAAGRDAQFTVNVDGKQIGGLQTVTASHAAGQKQAFEFRGNYGVGTHTVTVTFANNSMTQGDKAAFNDGGDRNLYVDSVTYDGTAVKTTTTPIYTSPLFPPNGPLDPGNAVFTVNCASRASAPSGPSASSDIIRTMLSEPLPTTIAPVGAEVGAGVGAGVEVGGIGLVDVPAAGPQASVGLLLLHHRLSAFSCQTRPFS
ncbi:MAG: hypothetical protein J0H35_10990, partial [Rhodospirillales bacterium]|nr:hypothetical protein [Rhodospirillales bacterium]